MAEEEKKPEAEAGEADNKEGEAAGSAEGEAAPKKASKLPIILAATLPIIIILGVQVGLFYAGVFDKFLAPPPQAVAAGEGAAGGDAQPVAPEDAPKKESKPENTIFHNLPDMLVNMMQDQGRISYLKLKVVLEVANKDIVEKLKQQLPRVLDTIQVYVRELRVDDLKNSAGVEKFRQEVLKRLNLVLDTKDIIDVYFPTMVTQ